MPKVVDHEEKRRNIAEAVFRLIGARGMEGVSLRDVAKEAEVSMGSVQHYFKTKDEMLSFALSYMRERVIQRLNTRLTRLKDPSRREVIRESILILLPLDRESAQEATINIAFFARSFGDKPTQATLRDGYKSLLEFSISNLREANSRGELNPEQDVDKEASNLFFTIQGLIGPTLIGAISKSEATKLVDYQLDQLFK